MNRKIEAGDKNDRFEKGQKSPKRQPSSRKGNPSLLVFSNWRTPSPLQLVMEFENEHELKGCRFWRNKGEFMQAVAEATCEKITPEMDASISYRSRTRSKVQLLALIKTYKSYPEYRNEATIAAIYEGYEKNLPMDRPLLVESSAGRWRVFSGNTRMDAAFQLGIEPEVLVLKSSANHPL